MTGAAKTSTLPDRPEAAQPGITGLCTSADELSRLLERETLLVRAMKLKQIAPLQAEKARLTKLCGATLEAIDPAAPIATALKERWRAASKRLGDAAIANEMALRVGHTATDRLISAIVGQIEQRQSAGSGYTRPAAAAPRRPRLAGVTFDRHL